MAVLHTEYLVFSALSYCIFGKEDIDKNVFELLEFDEDNSKERILLKNDIILAFDFLSGWENIGKNLVTFLKEWFIVDILDKTDDGNSTIKSGFYGIVFGKKNGNKGYKNLVIAYRGSQLFPLKEAYRDFIETDFLIGMGKKPKQFDEGLELYKKVIEKYDYKDVRLTGHSLGGGIAQYTGVMSPLYTKNHEFIPKTITFNAIGILVENMIKTEDFLKFTDSYNIVKKIGYEYKWEKILKIMQNLFVKKADELIEKIQLQLNDFELKSLHAQFIIKGGNKVKEMDLQELLGVAVTPENLALYNEGLQIVKDFSDNKKYSKKMKSYVHSLDFTASFLPHMGKTIFVDKGLKESIGTICKKTPLNLQTFQKEMMTYHLFDVFIPYIAIKYGISDEEHEYFLSKKLNLLYIAASIRKLIYEEHLSLDIIVLFHKQKRRLNAIEFLKIKNQIIADIKEMKETFLYKNQIIDSIEKLNENEFKTIWFEALDRLASPFEQIDIFDHILYVYNVKNLKNIVKPITNSKLTFK